MSLLISVVTPSYNQGHFIKQTLDSVLCQDYRNVEHIIMDGGSTDDTLAVLQAYGDPRLTWKSERDNGQSDAINKGLRQAKGDILAYLNSDDVYLPGTLDHVAAYFEAHPDIDVLYGSCYTIDAAGQRIEPAYHAKPINVRQFLTKRFKLPQQAAFWRRHVTEQIGFFDESLHYRMDFDYWLRMLIAGLKFAPCAEFLAEFRVHDSSKTVSQADRFWQDWAQIINKVYGRSDLPAEILALKPLAIAYVHHYAAEALLEVGQNGEARQHLRQIITGGATLRLKALSAAMVIDSYIHTPFTAIMKSAYRMAKGMP